VRAIEPAVAPSAEHGEPIAQEPGGGAEPAISRPREAVARRRARARMTEPAPAKTDSNGRWIPLAP
jgi:hypothetical protein